MGPKFGLTISILGCVAMATIMTAAPVPAQTVDEVWRALNIDPDPISRSPRLLGMGRMTLVVDDWNNRITLWDYARNPVGTFGDSISRFELRPSTASSSAVHDVLEPPTTFERQDFASREVRMDYEGRYQGRETSFGVIGSVNKLRVDRPFDVDTERRTQYTVPSAMPILAGKMPYLWREHLRYALRMNLSYQSSEDRYRAIVKNAVGEYIDRDGDIGEPPNLFTPDEYSIQTIGGGAAIGVTYGAPFSAAIGYDRATLDIEGVNTGDRYNSQTEETRPYGVGQASAVGRVGIVEWGADARSWKSESGQTWNFTLSSGAASAPLAGRGKLLDREDKGNLVRGRLRARKGRIQAGAGARYSRRRISITAPPASDPSSFNAFRNRVHHTPVAGDSLVLPDSISTGEFEENDLEASAGIGADLPWRNLIVAVEFHHLQQETERELAGVGPRRLAWDVRAGLEMPVNPTLALRGGYIHRDEERDELTASNEYLSNGVTFGIGLHPVGSRWTFESGMLFEWANANFGDPGLPRNSRQQVAMQLFWTF